MNFETFVNIPIVLYEDCKTLLLRFNYTAVFHETIGRGKFLLDLTKDNLQLSANPIKVTDLQSTLFTIFLAIISLNLLLIAIYWKKYGGVISDRFIRPSEKFYES